MNTTPFLKAAFFCLTAALFVSCDKDFNEIGSDIVGDDHFGIRDTAITVVAFNQKLGPVQTSNLNSLVVNVTNLPISALGYYNNPVFGKTTASFVTQLELSSPNPTIGDNPVVKKVELTIPYFSVLKETNDDGSHVYRLDSIRGESKIKLSIHASNYFLRDLDPATGFQTAQKYYSDQAGSFNNVYDPLRTERLNDSIAVSQNDEFFFDPAEIVTHKLDDNGNVVVDKRIAPEMKLSLNKQFFTDKIFGSAAAGKLATNNAFKEWFRGLYFKVENAASSPNQGSLGMINFKQGKITITYEVDGEDAGTRVTKTMEIKLTGNSLNVYENEDSPTYLNAVSGADPVNGDEKLYLKGNEGSMAIIDLFGPGELATVKNKGWLVNEANLTFYVDKGAMSPAGPDEKASEPRRIYLYDLNNHRPLIDYYTDVTTVGNNPKNNKYIHGGIMEVDSDKRGTRYKIRITNHIRNLIGKDSTNVRLGLVVTESINNITNASLKTPISLISPSATISLDRVPAASVVNPLGTILYGTRSNVPENKKLKLEIFYTKPN